MYAEVLIEYNNKSIDKTFTYLVPSFIKDTLKVGMKVKVPFGNKVINGFVTKIKNEYNDTYQLKEIVNIVDKYLILNEEMLSLGTYLQQKTLCTKIAAYQTMLPSSLKVKDQKTEYAKYLYYIELNQPNEVILTYINKYPRRKKQITILQDLLQQGKILKSTYSSPQLNDLITDGLVKVTKEQIYRINNEQQTTKAPSLTLDQQTAIAQVRLMKEQTYLLHGVTGSGKTEVYMQLITKVLENNQTALMLVPEISLTTQIINRFYSRFGSDVAIFHSALSDGEKYD